MYLFALDPAWNDFYTAGGFFVGVIGFAAAFYQIRETKRAAIAARDAANKSLAETKEAYERFVGAFASRLFAELRSAVTGKDWSLANIRSHDLAELLATLPSSGDESIDAAGIESVRSLREFGQAFAETVAAKKPQPPAKLMRDRWKPLLQLLDMRLDRLKAPFREKNDGQSSARNPTSQVQGDRPEPRQEDTSGRSELGSNGGGNATP